MTGEGTEFERLYETARALGEESRFAIYRRICDAQAPVGVRDLARDLPLHANAIRQHLARLEDAGLVLSRTEHVNGGAGRPRRLFEPTPEPLDFAHPPRSVRTLVQVLAGAVDALPGDPERLTEFGRRWAVGWAGRRASRAMPRTRRGRVEDLTRELRAWGWRPRTIHEDGETRLTTGRCLFGDLAPGANGRCCALEEGLLTGLAEALTGGRARVIRRAGCRLELVVA